MSVCRLCGWTPPIVAFDGTRTAPIADRLQGSFERIQTQTNKPSATMNKLRRYNRTFISTQTYVNKEILKQAYDR